jgi:hypothetical protein
MSSVEIVEEALIQAGEWRAAERTGGFQVTAPTIDAVIVRWCPPAFQPDTGDAIAFMEDYAWILRRAGFSATVVLDRAGPRVLCAVDGAEDESLVRLDHVVSQRAPRAARR